ncbi:MAG TPA: hypothetical protein VNQ76_18890 [Planctomicrobium sp.]|nr:hypothetical protein [Planctomicrobium sp.]
MISPGNVFVRGTVLLDRIPLDGGRIAFVSEEAPDPKDEEQWHLAATTNGHFEIEIPPGRYHVRIQKYERNRESRRSSDKPLLPRKYDQETTLSAEITEQGANSLLFELES